MAITTTEREPVQSLYVLKCICALMVVTIHAPVGAYRAEVNIIASVAVPLFFMMTGYFLYDEGRSGLLDKLRTAIRKVLIVLAITQIVHAFLPHSGFPMGRSLDFYLRWLILGINHNNMHLWYLSALLESLALLWLIVRFGMRRIIGYLPILFVLHYLLSGYIFIEPKSVYWTSTAWMWWRYVLATGLAMIAMGMMIRHWEARLIRVKYTGVMVLVMIALTYVSELLLRPEVPTIVAGVSPAIRIVLLVSIFATALRYRQFGSNTIAEYIGRYLSGNIYYWHILVLYMISHHLRPNVYNTWAVVYTFVLSAVLAELIRRLQRKLHIHWLQ